MDHFYIISWHNDHPISEYSFSNLKHTLQDRGESAYTMTCPKVYTPYRLCQYLQTYPDIRCVTAASNLTTDRQLAFLRQLTSKTLCKPSPDIDKTKLANKADSLRGQKYDFITKIMKHANSTDFGDIMLYCMRTAKSTTQTTWQSIHKNTANFSNIIAAAVADVQSDANTRADPRKKRTVQQHDPAVLARPTFPGHI